MSTEVGRCHQFRPLDWLVVAILGGAVLLLAWPSLAPSSLWLDDAWQTLIIKARTWHDIKLVSLTAPGYTLALKGWFDLAGFSELRAQLPGLTCALMLPGATYAAARAWGIGRFGALLGGSLMAFSPTLLMVGTRVKQFSLNALLALGLIWIASRIVDTGPSLSRWAGLLGLCIGAIVVSGAVAPVAGGVIVVVIAVTWRRDRGRRPVALLALAGFLLFSLIWWFFYLRNAVNPALRNFWNAFYVGVRNPWEALGGTGRALLHLTRHFADLPALVPAVGLLLAALIGMRLARDRTLLLITPIFVALVLAALRLAPLGGGRTDTYLYPGLALLAATALDGLGLRRRFPVVPMVTATLIAWVVFLSQPVGYPQEDVRPLVQIMDASAPSTQTIVYPNAQFAYALYTSRSVTFIANQTRANGFDVAIDRTSITILDSHRQHPDLYLPEIESAVRGQGRVWFLASHLRPDLVAIHEDFGTLGFHSESEWNRPGAELVEYGRRS